ncbi:hypothetical protein V1264_015082 [Littorina saxatilis]
MDTDDDFLEAIFMNENRCQDEGFLEGQADGRRKGLQEGFHLGCQKGCEIGTEIGFYLGFSQTIKLNLLDSSKNKDRVLKAVNNLNELIGSFPLTEAQHPSLQEQIQAVRAKFKQVTSLLGIQTQFSPGGVVQGASF